MRARRYIEAKLFAKFMSQISLVTVNRRRIACEARLGRTVCGMWHRKTIRPGGASGWSGTNHLRNVASQDGPPWRSEQPIRNESPAECGIARRPALAERAANQERTVCGMWHRKTIRPNGASSQSGTNRLRNVVSHDDLP